MKIEITITCLKTTNLCSTDYVTFIIKILVIMQLSWDNNLLIISRAFIKSRSMWSTCAADQGRDGDPPLGLLLAWPLHCQTNLDQEKSAGVHRSAIEFLAHH